MLPIDLPFPFLCFPPSIFANITMYLGKKYTSDNTCFITKLKLSWYKTDFSLIFMHMYCEKENTTYISICKHD